MAKSLERSNSMRDLLGKDLVEKILETYKVSSTKGR
jgi:hypothetical protein